MKIMTDSGMDIAPECLAELDVQIVPLTISLEGRDYQGAADITPDAFYKLLRETGAFPTTSQPSPADFYEVYRKAAAEDPDIISIHMSADISGTYNAARLGAMRVIEEIGADITVVDSRNVSGVLGWMVEAAARTAKAGWQREDILQRVHQISQATTVIFSPEQIRYLVHGGRVSHIQGFAASMMNIKPVLNVKSTAGKVETVARVRTMKKAILRQIDVIAAEWGEETPLRLQVEHADNPALVRFAREQLAERFDAHFVPDTAITPLIGAHTGPGMVGIVYAPLSLFNDLP
jgi:DegV family protein with EDD domain